MIFIEAINRATPQQTKTKHTSKDRSRAGRDNQDSVNLSTAANEVKEVHLESDKKTFLNASISLFANLVEHILNHLFTSKLTITTPEELNIDNKEWYISLQIPPRETGEPPQGNSYKEPAIQKRPRSKQLIFTIPVKPSYGIPIEMTILLSTHKGSPNIPTFLLSQPKENTLPILKTPYSPDFIKNQTTHYHMLIDQDGEQDQLSPMYFLFTNEIKNQQDNIGKEKHNLMGLRLWLAKKRSLQPIILGDDRLGLIYIGHHQVQTDISNHHKEAAIKNTLYTKA